MSFSFASSLYDDCELDKKNQESTGPFNWITDNTVIESNDSCYLAAASPFMHNQFYSIPSNIVDAESELRGQTRHLSRCPDKKYNPNTQLDANTQKAIALAKIKECAANSVLIPEYTRLNKACNMPSTSINRFDILCEDVQNVNKIRSNDYIGTNTRLDIKDALKK